MVGIDRRTGRVIGNLASAYQGVEVVLTTRIGERLMRREFGAGIAELLGRLMTPPLFVAFQTLIATAIDLWEPRFAVRRVLVTGTVDQVRTGRAGFKIEADYLPRGHLGDMRVERVVSFSLLIANGSVFVEGSS
jgi:phage baseplate assembly protein W